jgi:hypothetical protein
MSLHGSRVSLHSYKMCLLSSRVRIHVKFHMIFLNLTLPL